MILGISGAEYGIRGFISAYNKDDGKLVWRWHTIPEPTGSARRHQGLVRHLQQHGRRHEPAAPRHRGGEGGDGEVRRRLEARRRLQLDDPRDRSGQRHVVRASAIRRPTSIPRSGRATTAGPIAWSPSNVNTGKLVWGYQYVPHDPWDLDAVSPPILADVKGADGQTVPAVITGGKTGWVYVHDRATGKLIRRSDPMIPQANLFTQPTAAGVRMLPGANGGVEWSPPRSIPRPRLVYCSNLHQPMTYNGQDGALAGGQALARRRLQRHPGEDQWGNVSAVDLDTGKIAWQAKSEDPMIGGTLTTAGDLTFAGEGEQLHRLTTPGPARSSGATTPAPASTAAADVVRDRRRST